MLAELTRFVAARPLLLALLWLGCALCLHVPCAAQERQRVVVFSTGSPALAERLRAELTQAGFSAQVQQEATTLEGALRMRETAAQEGAELAVTLRLLSDRIELTIYDLKHDRGVVHELPVASASDEPSLAQHVVQLVRANPNPDADAASANAATATTSAPPAPPAATIDAPPPPTRSYAGIALGLAVLGGPGGYGPSLALSLDAGAYVLPALRLAVFALFPLTAQHLRAGSTTTTTRFTPFGAEARWHFRRDSRLRPSLAAGFSAVACVIEGNSVPPGFSSGRTLRWSTGLFVRPGLAYHLTRIISVRTDATLGVQFSSFALKFVDETIARWGKPWFAGSLAIDVSLP